MDDDRTTSDELLAETQIDRMPRLRDSSVPGTPAAAGVGTPAQVRYFGVYELLEEIARGGMGVVYKARQNTLNRTVAVKVILSGQLASAMEVKRFLVEAEAAANLNHPGIVPVYEFGEFDGTHYFSMAYVDGPSLAGKVADQAVSPGEAVNLLIQITDAVHYAHGQGVIHRDLKPGNILLEKGVTPRIADFGLAKRIGEDAELTQTGTVMGSVYYMPPEQAAGRIEDIGPASDIYALGAILYKLLTGRPPFQAASNYETIQQVIAQEPVRPRQLNPAIPRDLETICLKCLEKEPRRRYESAAALGEELTRYKEGHPIQARPIGRAARTARWCLRNPLPAGLGAGLALVFIAGVLSASYLWIGAQAERIRTADQQRLVYVLSNLVLEKTLDETDEWLRLFFTPVERELLVARDWGETGFLDKQSPDSLNGLLQPLIKNYPQISSLMVADGRGREHMILCIESDGADGGDPDRQWKNRITRRDEWGDQVQWREWRDGESGEAVRDVALPDYDPRARPWYVGALAATAEAGAGSIYWTEPYVFFTTKDLGITASIQFDRGDGIDQVVAFDVLLEAITAYTAGKQPTENGMVLVLTDAMELIGLPRVEGEVGREEWKEGFLKRPAELEMTAVADAGALFSFSAGDAAQIRRFQSEGQAWWGGVRPFQLAAGRRLWVMVLVPERDLKRDLATMPANGTGGQGADVATR